MAKLTAQAVLAGKYGVGDIFRLQIVGSDIVLGECGNRRKCVLALGCNRQLGLRGRGYITVDANELAFTTIHGHRVHMVTPKPAMLYLRKFDLIGEREGLEAARSKTKPADFNFKVYQINNIPPRPSRARMDRINQLRNERNAELRARGIVKRSSKRYSGV